MRIEIIEKEKSFELSKLKIDFFINASHELKTPLSLVIAPLSKLISESKNSRFTQQLSSIYDNTLKLSAFVQQIIGFEKFDGNSNHLVISHIEFIEFAKGIFSVYEDAFQRKNQLAIFESNCETLMVNIDVIRMESVLNNLISNASKYTPVNGSIKFEILYIPEKKSWVQIRVNDTGIGIPTNDIQYVFDRYFQSRKTTGNEEGSGVGLNLVKMYVEQHNGNVQVNSIENQGTSFIVNLPIVYSDPESLNKPEVFSELVSTDKPLILIVEDNLEVSHFLENTLEKNYRCKVAHNGRSGLSKALELKPDLIIADVMMPVMDGVEMCSQIRKISELALIPIIMLTAKDDRLTEKRVLKLE